MPKPIGVVFVLADGITAASLKRKVLQASASVPEGRLLFVVWSQADTWKKSLPVESIVTQAVLGPVPTRDNSAWDFYGCGTARLYKNKGTRPSSSVMWVGLRRRGPKAYLRLRSETVPASIERASRIPVSHKVFTRDVANNVWHLTEPRGIQKVVARLQSLTTWNDEIAEIHNAAGVSKRKHQTVSLDNDLVPVASKIEYQIQDFPFAAAKGSVPVLPQLELF